MGRLVKPSLPILDRPRQCALTQTRFKGADAIRCFPHQGIVWDNRRNVATTAGCGTGIGGRS
jgi:hypothetical protein